MADSGFNKGAIEEALSRAMIDARLPTPLYQQLFLALREKIRSGAFAPGVLLPGEQELSKLFEVSRITVKRALNELAAAGLVSRHRGRGTIVTYNAAAPVVKASFENFLANVRLMGLSTEVELISVSERPAAEQIAELLELAPGAPVQHAVRLRKLEGEPFSYLITHVPMDIARGYRAEDLSRIPLLHLLESAGWHAEEAEQWVSACAAEAPIAHALGITAGAPLLNVVRVMRDARGRPIEALNAYYRPDRFQNHMKLTRKKRGGGREEWI
jgi:GntR family transcriptional regulator